MIVQRYRVVCGKIFCNSAGCLKSRMRLTSTTRFRLRYNSRMRWAEDLRHASGSTTNCDMQWSKAHGNLLRQEKGMNHGSSQLGLHKNENFVEVDYDFEVPCIV